MYDKPFMYLRQYYQRWVRRNVFRPIKGSQHAPTYFARGSFVGLFIALTPTVGIQIPILVFVWGLTRRFFPRWDFSLVLAGAWTLISNVVTLPFFYYVYLQTGRVLLGRWERLRPFETFQKKFTGSSGEDADWITTLLTQTLNLFDNVGLPLFVGCLPWALLGAWLGYWWTLQLVMRLRARKSRANRQHQ